VYHATAASTSSTMYLTFNASTGMMLRETSLVLLGNTTTLAAFQHWKVPRE
jgi:hypothetical protein